MSGEPGSEWFAGTLLEPQYPSSQQQQGVHRLNSSLGTCILQKNNRAPVVPDGTAQSASGFGPDTEQPSYTTLGSLLTHSERFANA